MRTRQYIAYSQLDNEEIFIVFDDALLKNIIGDGVIVNELVSRTPMKVKFLDNVGLSSYGIQNVEYFEDRDVIHVFLEICFNISVVDDADNVVTSGILTANTEVKVSLRNGDGSRNYAEFVRVRNPVKVDRYYSNEPSDLAFESTEIDSLFRQSISFDVCEIDDDDEGDFQ